MFVVKPKTFTSQDAVYSESTSKTEIKIDKISLEGI